MSTDNKDRNEYKKAWRASNPEKEKAYARKAYERRKKDPEYIAKERAYHAKWQKENKDKWNAYCRERRRKKKASEENTVDGTTKFGE